MKLVNKKKIILNGVEYYISIKKGKLLVDRIILWTDWYYFIKIYIKNSIRYKQVFKHKVYINKFKSDIDKVIEYAFDEFKLNLKETKYMNDSSEQIIIDKEWKEAIYKELYQRVIQELKDKHLLKNT